jgi:hypothetical protein
MAKSGQKSFEKFWPLLRCNHRVRDLAKIEVIKSAAIAALLGCLACYPRLDLWSDRPYPIWYLELLLVLGGSVFWAFVFAWHTKYNNRPVFNLKPGPMPFTIVTLAAVLLASLQFFVFDPPLRARLPNEYPSNAHELIATILFSLSFTHLFLVFAPFDWAMRLFKHQSVAITVVILLGMIVIVQKLQSMPETMPPGLVVMFVVARGLSSLVAVWLYARYGVALVWWWSLLLQARYLLTISTAN